MQWASNMDHVVTVALKTVNATICDHFLAQKTPLAHTLEQYFDTQSKRIEPSAT